MSQGFLVLGWLEIQQFNFAITKTIKREETNLDQNETYFDFCLVVLLYSKLFSRDLDFLKIKQINKYRKQTKL